MHATIAPCQMHGDWSAAPQSCCLLTFQCLPSGASSALLDQLTLCAGLWCTCRSTCCSPAAPARAACRASWTCPTHAARWPSPLPSLTRQALFLQLACDLSVPKRPSLVRLAEKHASQVLLWASSAPDKTVFPVRPCRKGITCMLSSALCMSRSPERVKHYDFGQYRKGDGLSVEKDFIDSSLAAMLLLCCPSLGAQGLFTTILHCVL